MPGWSSFEFSDSHNVFHIFTDSSSPQFPVVRAGLVLCIAKIPPHLLNYSPKKYAQSLISTGTLETPTNTHLLFPTQNQHAFLIQSAKIRDEPFLFGAHAIVFVYHPHKHLSLLLFRSDTTNTTRSSHISHYAHHTTPHNHLYAHMF